MDSATLGFLLVLLGLAAFFALLGAAEKRRRKAALRKALLENFGVSGKKSITPERYALIDRYYREHPRAHQLDDITWNDLDMDSVYRRIDSTVSAAGEEYLYYLLRSPQTSQEAPPLLDEEMVAYFTEAHPEEKRLFYQEALAHVGKQDKYSLYDYLDQLEEVETKPLWKHLLFLVLPPAAACLLFVWPEAVLVLLLVCIGSVLTYFPAKRRIEPYIQSFRVLLQLMAAGRRITDASKDALFSKQKEELRDVLKDLAPFAHGSFLLTRGSSVMSSNPLEVLWDYLLIFLHLDLFQFDRMLRTLRAKTAAVDRLVALLGEIDATIAVAGFRRSLPHWCCPVWEETGQTFVAKGLFHPLLKAPVANDIAAEGPVLLTGSNASGKSTFLKSVALCALLSQTLYTAPANAYRGVRFHILTSLSLRDSLEAGESYFMVEIKALRRILEAGRQEPALPLLCCVDEVLRGTNTIERIAASTEILRVLAARPFLCFAATHDLELTELLDTVYTNRHFGETMEGEDIHFSYLLQEGPATTRNAILLLRHMGYDRALVEAAERRADQFMETGSWKK